MSMIATNLNASRLPTLSAELQAMPSASHARFEELLNLGMSALNASGLNHPVSDKADPESQETKAHQAAEQLVAGTLVLPLLKQMRKSAFATPLFHGGMAEDSFRAQLDELLADRIVGKANFPMVTAIYKNITARNHAHANADTPVQGKVNLRG